MNPDVLAKKNGLPEIKPGRRFFRFDWLFNDAVRSKKRSKLIEVLLRLEVPGRRARRIAEKILANDGLDHTSSPISGSKTSPSLQVPPS